MEPRPSPFIFGEQSDLLPPSFTHRRGFAVSDLLNPNEPNSPQVLSSTDPSHSRIQQQSQQPTWPNSEMAARDNFRQVQIPSWTELYAEEPWATPANPPQTQFNLHPHPQSLANGPADDWMPLGNLPEISEHASILPRNYTGWNGEYSPLPVPRPPFDPLIQSPVQALKRTASCIICLGSFGADTTDNNFPHKCLKCHSANICTTCLRSWFLDACKNESKMPPKCCRIIPLSTVSTLLSVEEIELYKAKFEEWSTADRIYCPVPTCSAFIPQRLYSISHIPSSHLDQPNSPPHFQGELLGAFQSVNYAPTRPETGGNGRLSASHKSRPNVSCPDCQTSICTGCRSYWHLGECPPSDLDPELEANLQRWKIKRCPKCRAGLRKIYGCSHVECRCGAHFCWECRKPISMCTGCDESDDEHDDHDYEFEEDDIDGRANYFEGDGHDLGPEPYGAPVDHWACPQHRWNPAVREGGRNVAECHRCFQTVKLFDSTQNADVRGDNYPVTGYTTEPGWPTNVYGEPAWQCVEGHLRCERCPKIAPPDRFREGSWEIRCGCGMECEDCARSKKEKERGMGWDCRCGMVACGNCKELLSATAQDIRGLNEAVERFRRG